MYNYYTYHQSGPNINFIESLWIMSIVSLCLVYSVVDFANLRPPQQTNEIVHLFPLFFLISYILYNNNNKYEFLSLIICLVLFFKII